MQITNGAHSPLRYPGGKGKITQFVNNILEENGINGTYIEPLAGGAGVAINLLLAGKVDKIIINDLDNGVYAFWYTLVHSPKYLINHIKKSSV
jgi:DNA adenine methylase